MKKIFMMVCSAAILGIATLAQAQDSTSTDFNNQSTVEQQTQDDSKEDASSDVNQGTISTEDQAQQGAQPTEDQTDQATDQTNSDQATDQPSEITPVEDKVGPNGEAVFMENGKYYYMNEAGEKKKIKKSELKDKTQ